MIITRHCPDFRSYRAERVKSLFSVESGSTFTLTADIPPLPPDWRIGLIVGPSGSGKSTLGSEIHPGTPITDLSADWPSDQPIIDAISPAAPFDSITSALAAVGLGTVPAWLRPYPILSNGEKFRAGLARILTQQPPLAIIDEFTSVIDRQIAAVASVAFAKAVRRLPDTRVTLLSCHYDIIDWLQPDWMFDTATGKFTGACLRCRPSLRLELAPCHRRQWSHFERHHYLKVSQLPPGLAYLGILNGTPIAFCYVKREYAPNRTADTLCRIVILPDYQGIGIGVRLATQLARYWHQSQGRRLAINTRHPQFVHSLTRHGWELRKKKLHGRHHKNPASQRESLTACGSYLIGPPS